MTAPAISFTVNGNAHSISLPPRQSDDIDSVFLVGLPKAGSTLLNRIMTPICARAGLEPFALHSEMRQMGLQAARFPDNVDQLYDRTGYAYVGYRTLTPHDKFPAFANGRTVFLVRDPRDMVVSNYFSEAFSHRPPGSKADDKMAKAFAARREELQSTTIDDYVLEKAPTVLQAYTGTQDQLSEVAHKTWRYEDIVFEKMRWTREMVDYLGLDVAEPMIARIVERQDIKPATESVNEHVRKVTPGDHKDKLQPETIAAINDIFAGVLSKYGYDT